MTKFFAFCIAMWLLFWYGWEEAAYKVDEWGRSVDARAAAIRAEIRRRHPEDAPPPPPPKRKLVPLWPKSEPGRAQPKPLTEEQWQKLDQRGQQL